MPPLLLPPPPAACTCTARAPCTEVEVEVAGADAQAEVAGLARVQRGGRFAPAAGVAYSFPDPSRLPRLRRLAPSPFPDLRWRAAPLTPPSVPRLRMDSCTLTLRPQVCTLLHPPFLGLHRLATSLPAGREVMVRRSSRAHAGAHAGLLRPASAWPPVRTSPLQESGCVSTTLCVVPRARPRVSSHVHDPVCRPTCTTPCVVPRAQPRVSSHMHDPVCRPTCTTPAHPPFGRHPAHAVPHAGQHPRGT